MLLRRRCRFWVVGDVNTTCNIRRYLGEDNYLVRGTLPICQIRTRIALVASPTCISARRPSVKKLVTYDNTRQTSTWPGTYRNCFMFRAGDVIPRGGAISENIRVKCILIRSTGLFCRVNHDRIIQNSKTMQAKQ